MASFRYHEKGNIEAQFFNIQAKLKANGQKTYTPPEGKLIHDIESAWMRLEKAEHGREVALRDELIRSILESEFLFIFSVTKLERYLDLSISEYCYLLRE